MRRRSGPTPRVVQGAGRQRPVEQSSVEGRWRLEALRRAALRRVVPPRAGARLAGELRSGLGRIRAAELQPVTGWGGRQRVRPGRVLARRRSPRSRSRDRRPGREAAQLLAEPAQSRAPPRETSPAHPVRPPGSPPPPGRVRSPPNGRSPGCARPAPCRCEVRARDVRGNRVATGGWARPRAHPGPRQPADGPPVRRAPFRRIRTSGGTNRGPYRCDLGPAKTAPGTHWVDATNQRVCSFEPRRRLGSPPNGRGPGLCAPDSDSSDRSP